MIEASTTLILMYLLYLHLTVVALFFHSKPHAYDRLKRKLLTKTLIKIERKLALKRASFCFRQAVRLFDYHNFNFVDLIGFKALV